MTEALVEALYETLRHYGTTILTTPRVLEMSLGQKCRPSANESAALMAAVTHGIVQDLFDRPHTEMSVLAGSLSGRSGLPLHTARWSVEIWQRVVGHVIRGEPPPRALWDELRHPSPPRRDGTKGPMAATAAAALVALVAAIAGGLPGLLIAWGVEHQHPQTTIIRQKVEHHEPAGVRMSPREFGRWAGSLGAVGGFLGGLIGWMGGGFTRITGGRLFGGMMGALWAFDGAIFGMTYAGLTGMMFGPLFAGAIAVFVGSLLGFAGLVLVAKPVAWLIVDHF